MCPFELIQPQSCHIISDSTEQKTSTSKNKKRGSYLAYCEQWKHEEDQHTWDTVKHTKYEHVFVIPGSTSFAIKLWLIANIVRWSNLLVCLHYMFGRFILISVCWTDSSSQKCSNVVGKLSQFPTFSFDVIPSHPIWLMQSNMCIFKYELAFGHLQSHLLLSVLNFYFLSTLKAKH